jgi:sirohydrochlorin ferrochelatase
MLGILILAHGSREKETEKTLATIIDMVKKELSSENIENIECAFLQFVETNLEKGLLKLIEKGSDDIKVIPYFLFEGVHIKEDIPMEINEFLKEYPNVKISFGKTLGTDERLAQIVADRVREVI